jgi:hypothetical protein
MEPLDFFLYVLPLAFLVFLLAFLVFHVELRRSSFERRLIKLKKQLEKGAIDEATYGAISDWIKREEAYKEELDNLQKLRESDQITERSYLRLKELLKGMRQYSTSRPSLAVISPSKVE